MKLLFDREIGEAQRALADETKELDVASFNYGPDIDWILPRVGRIRLLFGVFEEHDFKRAWAYLNHCLKSRPKLKLSIRYLRGSHAKIFIAHFSNPHKVTAIIGSANIGALGSREIAARFGGKDAIRASAYFSMLWDLATPVKPLELDKAKALIEQSVFESQGRPFPQP